MNDQDSTLPVQSGCGCGPDCRCGPDCACAEGDRCGPACACE